MTGVKVPRGKALECEVPGALAIGWEDSPIVSIAVLIWSSLLDISSILSSLCVCWHGLEQKGGLGASY